MWGGEGRFFREGIRVSGLWLDKQMAVWYFMTIITILWLGEESEKETKDRPKKREDGSEEKKERPEGQEDCSNRGGRTQQQQGYQVGT